MDSIAMEYYSMKFTVVHIVNFNRATLYPRNVHLY